MLLMMLSLACAMFFITVLAHCTLQIVIFLNIRVMISQPLDSWKSWWQQNSTGMWAEFKHADYVMFFITVLAHFTLQIVFLNNRVIISQSLDSWKKLMTTEFYWNVSRIQTCWLNSWSPGFLLLITLFLSWM